MVAISAIIISVLGSSQSGETQTIKETQFPNDSSQEVMPSSTKQWCGNFLPPCSLRNALSSASALCSRRGPVVCKHSLHAEPAGRGGPGPGTSPLGPCSLSPPERGEKLGRDWRASQRLLHNSALQTKDNEMENSNGQNEYIRAGSLMAWCKQHMKR